MKRIKGSKVTVLTGVDGKVQQAWELLDGLTIAIAEETLSERMKASCVMATFPMVDGKRAKPLDVDFSIELGEGGRFERSEWVFRDNLEDWFMQRWQEDIAAGKSELNDVTRMQKLATELRALAEKMEDAIDSWVVSAPFAIPAGSPLLRLPKRLRKESS